MNDWKKWAKGLASAFIGAAANSITVVIVDPVNFNPVTQTKKVLIVALVSGALAVALYLKQSPLPPDPTVK